MWNGIDQAQLRKIENVWFDPTMKPEDIAFGSIDRKSVVVVLDENGGYGVLGAGFSASC